VFDLFIVLSPLVLFYVWKVSNTRAIAGSKDIRQMSLLSSHNAGNRRQAQYDLGFAGFATIESITWNIEKIKLSVKQSLRSFH
jgi:hypothetical protein